MPKFIITAKGTLTIQTGEAVIKTATWELEADDEITATSRIQTREERQQWPVVGTEWSTKEVPEPPLKMTTYEAQMRGRG